MRHSVSTQHFDADQKALFQQLTHAPKIAWITVAMCATLAIGVIGTDVLAVNAVIPLWAGLAINSVIGYLAFSVVHDAIHRSISSNIRFNDWVGRISVLLVVPYVDLGLFRWAHIQHHRFATGPNDPDRVFDGVGWSLPLRWAFIDALYFVHVLRKGDKVSRPFFVNTLWLTAAVAVVLATLFANGHGLQVLMLWFLPSRLIQMSLGFSFFWLPHAPHDTAQEDNFTRATTIRQGHEWLMNPALQYQNYHLIHHLYPSTPFYNNGRVYALMKPELERHDQAIQRGFSIRPEIRLAPKPAALARAA
jgi:fatty acid desaturase